MGCECHLKPNEGNQGIVKIRKNKLKKIKSIEGEGKSEIWKRKIAFIINCFEKDIQSLVLIVMLYIYSEFGITSKRNIYELPFS